MIEIGKESEFELTYAEAVLYCFILSDGWRLPTKEEYWDDNHPYLIGCWHLDDDLKDMKCETYHVIPVRDLKDD